MFEPAYLAKRVLLEEGKDLIAGSANNYYQGVTQQSDKKLYANHDDSIQERNNRRAFSAIVFLLGDGAGFARFFLPPLRFSLFPTIAGLLGFQIVVAPPIPLDSAASQTVALGIFVDHVDLAPIVGGLIAAANAVMGSVVMGDMNEAIPICGDNVLTDAITVFVVDGLGTQVDPSLEIDRLIIAENIYQQAVLTKVGRFFVRSGLNYMYIHLIFYHLQFVYASAYIKEQLKKPSRHSFKAVQRAGYFAGQVFQCSDFDDLVTSPGKHTPRVYIIQKS